MHNMIWWQGVVEDRADPLMLGRCRVRILGYHTDNKEEGVGIPTSHLPWATPSQPITSAAMNGIGTTPIGPVEGTWVFGFFRDGKNAQEPVIFGTFGGIPEQEANTDKGFNDPQGNFPRSAELHAPDTNRLATGVGVLPVVNAYGEEHQSLKYKRKSRQKNVATALAGDISTTIPHVPDSDLSSKIYDETPWHEPNPRYGGVTDSDTKYLDSVKHSSIYPLNHVRMSESGHVEEWDDTKGSERLHRYHKTGTFEEIQPDGTRVVKIIGNDYEITAGYKNVLINGACNVTIAGDCRLLYKGDLVQEVEGDYHLNVHGDIRTKIGGNQATEVLADRKTVVNGNCDLRVGLDQFINIEGNRTTNVTKNVDETISGNLNELTYGTMGTIVGENASFISAEEINIAAVGNLGLSTIANCDISVVGNVTETVSGNTLYKITGTYQQQITGATRLQYKSTLDERHEGHYKLYTGDDTSTVAVSGKTDHGCPTTRTGVTACNEAASVS